MNKMQQQVKEFHEAFNLPAPDKPFSVPWDPALRLKLIVEEAAEGFHALDALHRGDAGLYVDYLVDLLYFVYGAAVSAGIDLEPFFEVVHDANMAKLINGVAMYREDGKVLKPEGWEPADLGKVWLDMYGGGNGNGTQP